MNPFRSAVPSPLSQLALPVALRASRVLLLVPANILLWSPDSQPESLHVVPRLRVDVRHLAQEKFVQELLEEGKGISADGFPVYGEDSSGLEANTGRQLIISQQVLEILACRLGGLLAGHGRPLFPTGIFLPWYAVPAVEMLKVAPWESGHLTGAGFGSSFSEFCGVEGDVIVYPALEEDRDLGEAVVCFHEMVEVGVTLAANVGKG